MLGTAVASKPDGTKTHYWMASRYYLYSSTTYYEWSGRRVVTSGGVYNDDLYYYDVSDDDSGFYSIYRERSLRPILTLKSGLKYTGSGTEADPYVLSTE